MQNKETIINCHTHIFTGDHVPPFLAKKFVPTPFYLLLPLRPIVAFFRWWYKYPGTLPYQFWFKKLTRSYTRMAAFVTLLWPLNIIVGYYLFLLAFFLLYSLLIPVLPPEKTWLSEQVHKAYQWLKPILLPIQSDGIKMLVIILVCAFFPSIQNAIMWIARQLWKLLSLLPGKQTKELFNRYLNIGRYAFHRKQSTILSKLKAQYPKGTGFIILPMDMDYMDAGKSKIRYREQLLSLAELKATAANKDLLFPFVFIDPRRMVAVREEMRYQKGDKIFFDWTLENNRVKLKDCLIRDYIENKGFSGFKIYPALGYYPFDENLLPLWKYASDNDLPVLTHCIRGTIFYRGEKMQEWNTHPVFEQAMSKKKSQHLTPGDGYLSDEQREEADSLQTAYEPLVLHQLQNIDFTTNFTHPMNYLCLLEEELLRKLITKAVIKDPATRLKELFGYSGADRPMVYNLRQLKLCMGHFGGEDEWKRYFEKDRYNYSSQLTKNPKEGIRFFKILTGKPSRGKPEQIWKYTDWYSIICSMMLQYPRVYADISYILHADTAILPLLKQTLQNPGLRDKVLYGSDFFVVRNHKSDKHLLADLTGGLSAEEFDQIARHNPRRFL